MSCEYAITREAGADFNRPRAHRHQVDPFLQFFDEEIGGALEQRDQIVAVATAGWVGASAAALATLVQSSIDTPVMATT